MIKAIMAKPFVRKTVIGSMFAAAALGVNAANNKTSNPIQQPQYTEISSTASSAVSAAAMSGVTQQQPTRNTKLDSKIRNLAENDQELRENNDYLNTQYSDYGAFGASVEVQLMLDDILIGQAFTKFRKEKGVELWQLSQTLEDVKSGKISKYDNLITNMLLSDKGSLTSADVDKAIDKLAKNCDEMEAYLSNTFTKIRRRNFGGLLSQIAINNNGKPNFERTNAAIDENAKIYFPDKADYDEYTRKVNAFKAKNNSKLDLISYKLYLADYMIMQKMLNDSEYFKNNKEFKKYFDREFVNKAQP